LLSIKLCEDEKIIKLLKGLFKNFTKHKNDTLVSGKTTIQPVIIPRAGHTISRNAISHNVLKVLYRLHNAGFSAFLVGGSVRDILLGKRPKDFDIATNALPEEVRKLFRNCRLIGKRFRLAHIVFGKEIIEVATFRTHHKDGEEKHGHSYQGMIIRDNMYGTIEDDAWRRDFTVNALYYNIADYTVLDYTSGMQDLNDRVLRMIGNPEQRFHEDPVRLLRAMRFVGKVGLTISPETEKPILELSHLLEHVSPARLFQEVLKFFQEGATYATFKLLQKYHLFVQLFPQTATILKAQPKTEKLLEAALINTDERIEAGKTVSPAFLFAVFLWHPILALVLQAQAEGLPTHVAFEKALRSVLRQQTERLTIPRRLLLSIHDICYLQHRLTCRYGSIPYRLLDHPRFRAAYDLLILRKEANDDVTELCDWWIDFYNGTAEQREILMKSAAQSQPRKKRRPRKPRGKVKSGAK
jgi:poly(A) polymerase